MEYDAGAKLADAIVRQLGKVEYYCTAESISPDLAVHELRKSFKRLRALLRFYPQIAGKIKGKARKNIKRFGRILSPLRESYVNVGLFEDYLAGSGLVSEKQMKSTGKKLRHKNLGLISGSFDAEKLYGSVSKCFSGMKSGLIDAGACEVTLDMIIHEIGCNYLESHTRFLELPADKQAEKLHSLRKLMKRLYYQLDFLWLLHPGCFKTNSEQLDLINDQLGNDHDLSVFMEELRLPEYNFSKKDLSALGDHVNRLRGQNLMTLHPRLNGFFCEGPEEFEKKLESFFI